MKASFVSAFLLLSAAQIASAAPVAQLRPAPVASPAAHQRLLPLQGGRNFRDLGGYRTRDGRTVKWGVLFRSGSMHGLTPADFVYLEKRGIRVVCDFRDSQERAAEPVVWPEPGAPTVLADDYSLSKMSRNGSMPMPDARDKTGQKARAMFTAMYPRLLTAMNSQYRRMFAQLLAGRVPLAFNCTAGKDRTGIAAALILTALGVPRATVIQDYALTNRYLDPRALMPKDGKAASQALAKFPPAAIKALMAADPAYIKAALAVVDRHKGGAAGYFRDELGLSHADIVKLRAMYLE